jgi:hypothetical protein
LRLFLYFVLLLFCLRRSLLDSSDDVERTLEHRGIQGREEQRAAEREEDDGDDDDATAAAAAGAGAASAAASAAAKATALEARSRDAEGDIFERRNTSLLSLLLER